MARMELQEASEERERLNLSLLSDQEMRESLIGDMISRFNAANSLLNKGMASLSPDVGST